jgi:serine protease Do
MKKFTSLIAVIIVLAISLILVACGGAPATSEAPTTPVTQEEPVTLQPTTAPTEAPAEAPTEVPAEATAVPPAAPAAISSFQDVKPAIIQIEAQGSFVDPAEGLQLNSAGRGSGFIIDPSGTAVTNNHVVTGAAFLQVWVGGESKPRNARILGVSECSDLAVIDIDGEDYPYLAWYDGPVDVGAEIYVAGFPLGDPEYTLTRGIISKREANGETPWSSVAHVLEYDANTNPGNSGGAVIDADGRVIAVHYAGYNDARQAFGIGADVAENVVEQLRAGQDILAIGINGSAINDEQGLSGVWVSSVKSGSPADTAGVRPGDIITKMEGLVLATDGTMSDYCKILRSHDPDDVLGIEVLRYDTQEVLEGQLNGRPLELSFSFAQQLADENIVPEDSNSASGQQFIAITDDSEALYLEVPNSWAASDGSAWTDDAGQILGASLTAAPDLQAFNDTYTSPGVLFLASANLGDLTMDELVDNFDFSEDCAYNGRSPYEDPVYTGVFDLYQGCAGTDTILIVLAAQPADQSHSVVIVGQAITDADVEALDQVLNTFNVVGDLP